MGDDSDAPDLNPGTDRIRFDQIKSSLFRVIHVDGVFGGAAPNGSIHMAVFSERPPIPQQITVEIDREKKTVTEIMEERKVRQTFVRELEFDCVMSVDTAQVICDWLAQNIAKARAMQCAHAAEENN